jgi:primosomal replication protein N
VLRYSPAGVPLLDCVLHHTSTQHEAQVPRQISMRIAALAAGRVAVRLDKAPLGVVMKLGGFLANRSARGTNVVFHITEFDLDEKE